MKKLTLGLATGLMMLGMQSCQKTAESHPESTTNTAISMHEDEAKETSDSEDEITLNKGEKWAVNAEMKPYIEKSEKSLQDFIASKSNDYKALAATLAQNNSDLVKSCTMTGQSHEELHKWLHPHIELITELKEATDKHGAAERVTELQESFKIYHQYFQ